MAARGLYKATDGSWRQADADKGIPLLYRLKEGERWTLLDRDRAMVVHPERQPKIVYPDGHVDQSAKTPTRSRAREPGYARNRERRSAEYLSSSAILIVDCRRFQEAPCLSCNLSRPCRSLRG